MSSDDELGEIYESPVVTKAATTRSAKANQRAVAGPSNAKGAAGTKRRATRATAEVSDSDGKGEPVAEIEISDTEASVQVVAAAAKGKGKNVPVKGVNGHTTTAEKGKGKAATGKRTAKKTPAAPVPVADEDVDMVDETATGPASKRPKTSQSDETVRRLEKRLGDLTAERDALAKQLEEVHSVRYTEAEELAEQQKSNYEARLKTQDILIQELSTQLARSEPLARSGQTSSLHFMTREAVEEEKRSLEQEVAKWKEAANQEKQRRAELEQLEKELRFELNAEIERSKSLAAKGPSRDGPGSTTKGKFRGPGKEPTSMEGRVIRFYEDLTNLLVPKHYMEKSPHEGLPDEWCFSCVYTHAETSNALNFSLRLFSEPAPDGSDDLIDQVKYTPYELDKETDEFREKLGFFNTPFTFERSQLHVFLRSLGETVQNAAADQDNASENQGGEELVYPE